MLIVAISEVPLRTVKSMALSAGRTAKVLTTVAPVVVMVSTVAVKSVNFTLVP